MGADMVGYLVTGPVKITEAAIKKAISNLKKRDWRGECPECGEDRAPGGGCSCFVPPKSGEEEAFVRDWVAHWPPDYRDCAVRRDPRDPKKRWLVFAGDRSWGESPEGAGFEMLKRGAVSGIAEDLGVL
jgi:hypothetical protein